MHPPETPKAFEHMVSFQFIGWFVPVGSEPTLALKTMTCKKEVVWFPKFMTVQRKDGHTLRSGRRRWGENGKTRSTIAAQVLVLRGAHNAKRTAQTACQKDRMMNFSQWMHCAHLLR